MRPVGIDLFAGVGGMSLGFEQAGFDVVAAVEIDPVHCAAHAYNFPNCAVLPRSVIGLTGSEIRVASGLGTRGVDVVFGGAPCQGFSMIGQRVLDDPRNALVREFLRIVSELNPRYFVFENVKGLTIGPHKAFLAEFVALAKVLGYRVKVPWQVLNAACYGVPQHRERLILFGVKSNKRLPLYPEPTTRPASGRSRGSASATLPRGPSVEDALGDLPDAEIFKELWCTDEVRTDRWAEPSVYAQELRCLTNDAWHFGYVREWDRSLITSSARTDHTEISRRRFGETHGGKTEPVSRFYKLSAGGLSNTLRAGTDGSRGAFTSPRPIHYRYNRCVTVREMARLHGFPDWFRFNETKWHGARQIGNSVPPPMARAVAGSVMIAAGILPSRPFERVELGSTDLLRLTVGEAADRLGIERPRTGRDRSSGARKRKQHEIEAERLAQKQLANG